MQVVRLFLLIIKNNLITLKDNEKVDKIQSSTNLPSIKIVNAEDKQIKNK